MDYREGTAVNPAELGYSCKNLLTLLFCSGLEHSERENGSVNHKLWLWEIKKKHLLNIKTTSPKGRGLASYQHGQLLAEYF